MLLRVSGSGDHLRSSSDSLRCSDGDLDDSLRMSCGSVQPYILNKMDEYQELLDQEGRGSLTSSQFQREVNVYAGNFKKMRDALTTLVEQYAGDPVYEDNVEQMLALLGNLNETIGKIDEDLNFVELVDDEPLREIRYDKCDSSAVAECSVCEEEEILRSLVCGHSFCEDCLHRYVRSKISDGRVLDLNCMHSGCKVPISEQLLTEILSEREFQQLNEFRFLAELRANDMARWCPMPGCNTPVIAVREDSEFPKLNCPTCSSAFCFNCTDVWHSGKCEDVDSRNQAAAKQLEKYLESEGVKKCPKCGIPVIHAEGCVNITCLCGCRWCYTCMAIGVPGKWNYFWPTCNCTPGHVFYSLEEVQSHWGRYNVNERLESLVKRADKYEEAIQKEKEGSVTTQNVSTGSVGDDNATGIADCTETSDGAALVPADRAPSDGGVPAPTSTEEVIQRDDIRFDVNRGPISRAFIALREGFRNVVIVPFRRRRNDPEPVPS